MAASPSPASRSPLRIAGIALLGVGVIAAFAGLISTTQGDGNGTVAQPPRRRRRCSTPPPRRPCPRRAPASPAPDAAATAPFVPGSTADGSTGEGAPPPRRRPRCPSSPRRSSARPAKPTRRHRRRGRRAGSAGGGQPAVRARPAGLQQQPRPGARRSGRGELQVGRLDDRRGRRLPGQAPGERGLLPAGHGRGGGGEGAGRAVRAGRQAAVRRDPGRPVPGVIVSSSSGTTRSAASP